MGYKHGMTAQPATAVLGIEQARRLNADLRLELATLTAENTQLEARVGAMRQDVTVARRKLSRQIRDLETIRTQARNIAAMAGHSSGTEPVFGGPAGLLAAADELKAHGEAIASSTVRRGPSHGTAGKYVQGCRCDECRGWRGRKSAQERAHVKRRREQEIAEALRAHGVPEVAA